MKQRLANLLLFTFVLVGLDSDECLAARFWFGTTENIEFVGDAPDALNDELGDTYRVGYFFRGFHLLVPANVWTWDGEFVLYRNERSKEYIQLSDEGWRAAFGDTPSNTFSKPWQYRFPPGILVIAGAILVSSVVTSVKRSNANKAQADPMSIHSLSNDARFEDAVDMYIHECGEGTNPLILNTEALETAAKHLAKEHSLDEDVAAEGIGRLVLALAERSAAELRERGGELESAKQWQSAREAYEEAAALVKQWDENDSEFLLKCARRVDAGLTE